jgi:flagellar basal body-associated protein FliL
MQTKHNNTLLIIVVVILAVIVVVGIAIGTYFYGKSKSGTQTTLNASPTASETVQPSSSKASEPQVSPQKVVENFMNYSIGTITTASLNFDKARSYLRDDLKAEYSDDNTFAARFFGYQDGPTSVEIVSENISGDTAAVKVNAFWGEMGQGWAFSLVKVDNQWLISDFRNDAQ